METNEQRPPDVHFSKSRTMPRRDENLTKCVMSRKDKKCFQVSFALIK